MQRAAFGTDDPFFMTKYIFEIVSNIEIEGINILLDGIRLVAAAFIYEALALGLGVAAKVADLWATWGYALAKIIGPMFIPFFLLAPTRFLYSGWLRFFLGFLLFNIMVRAAMIVIAFQIRADFIAMGGGVSDPTGSVFSVTRKVILNKATMYLSIGDLIGTAVLALFFVYMAAKASYTLVGGGGGSSGASKMVTRMVTAGLGKFK